MTSWSQRIIDADLLGSEPSWNLAPLPLSQGASGGSARSWGSTKTALLAKMQAKAKEWCWCFISNKSWIVGFAAWLHPRAGRYNATTEFSPEPNRLT